MQETMMKILAWISVLIIPISAYIYIFWYLAFKDEICSGLKEKLRAVLLYHVMGFGILLFVFMLIRFAAWGIVYLGETM